MKRVIVLFAAMIALVISFTPVIIESPAWADHNDKSHPFPSAACDQGRSFFSAFIAATQPLAPVFGPGEEAFCGERKSYPGS